VVSTGAGELAGGVSTGAATAEVVLVAEVVLGEAAAAAVELGVSMGEIKGAVQVLWGLPGAGVPAVFTALSVALPAP